MSLFKNKRFARASYLFTPFAVSTVVELGVQKQGGSFPLLATASNHQRTDPASEPGIQGLLISLCLLRRNHSSKLIAQGPGIGSVQFQRSSAGLV
ncbi:hypothetical protein JTE90_016355 [Oedothorax gibbosus]|uniref:Uncharacterized protein n=1 Tax=Oedothorax gibbosus TaxID=931172 RepID=A0AAV6U618_9ARAC|nr:hypothetical protein JTE90_016355 [Oedothorax gibbosus]